MTNKGHIRTSINVPSATFVTKLSKLQAALAGANRVVFHCQLSQQRGPMCATTYAKHLASRGIRNQEVYILSGGFDEWARLYGTDPKCTESFVAELYAS